MSTSTDLLAKTAQKINISFSFVDETKSFLILHFPKRDHYIINTKLGLVTNTEEQMGRDKAYQSLFLADTIPIPKTVSYLDPHSKYGKFARFPSYADIHQDICAHFSFPLILKKNQGSEGVHVFKIEREAELDEKIRTIFNQQNSEYDFILLAQEYVSMAAEYRLVVYQQKLMFAYSKDISGAAFSGNLSPLHWTNAHAHLITQETKQRNFADFVAKLCQKWPIAFAGLDVVEDNNGKLFLLELNTAPSFALYIQDNGEDEVMKLYEKILNDLRAQYS